MLFTVLNERKWKLQQSLKIINGSFLFTQYKIKYIKKTNQEDPNYSEPFIYLSLLNKRAFIQQNMSN